jgi:bacillithiol biosynthesis cysteine-adding enzyme BshC
VDVHRLPWIRRLAADYATNAPALSSFFAAPPLDPAAWADAIARTTACSRNRSALAAVLEAQQDRRGVPPEARAAGRALARRDTVAVVTGQQAGLFGGPLFTMLKAVTAIALAARLEREHGVRAVPVFWIDAEDHDWDEVRQAAILDGELAVRTIEAAPPEGAGTHPIGSLTWPDAIVETVANLAAALPPTEFTPWVQDVVGRAYARGMSPAESFGRMLDQVLGAHGLVVYDASDPAAKPLCGEVFAAELEHAGRTALLAARAGAELVSRGYHMQVTPNAGAAALFDLAAGRRSIRKEGDWFQVGEDSRVPAAELIARARREPSGFSPNVLLRPIVQDTLFPTACYVAGPNELAYLAQLREVYEAHGVPMPLVVPRASATLVDAPALRFLTRQPIEFTDLQAQDERALNALLQSLLPAEVEHALARAREAIGQHMEAVGAAMPLVDPTLEGRARSALGRMEHELEGLSGKVLQAAKRRDDTLRRQFTHARAQAFPNGEPQERAISGVSFLNRYGPALVTRLLDELPVGNGEHWVVSV